MSAVSNHVRYLYDQGLVVSRVKCIVCRHEWTAIRPLGTTRVECPACHVFVQKLDGYLKYKDAIKLLEGAAINDLGRRIMKVLDNYKLQYSKLPLVDALTPRGDKSIARGMQELRLLADELTAQIREAVGL